MHNHVVNWCLKISIYQFSELFWCVYFGTIWKLIFAYLFYLKATPKLLLISWRHMFNPLFVRYLWKFMNNITIYFNFYFSLVQSKHHCYFSNRGRVFNFTLFCSNGMIKSVYIGPVWFIDSNKNKLVHFFSNMLSVLGNLLYCWS